MIKAIIIIGSLLLSIIKSVSYFIKKNNAKKKELTDELKAVMAETNNEDKRSRINALIQRINNRM